MNTSSAPVGYKPKSVIHWGDRIIGYAAVGITAALFIVNILCK